MAEESTQQPPERDPGAPFPRDAVDPELVALRKSAGEIGPVLAAAVLAFCAYMMITLRADLRFSRDGVEPVTVDDIGALVADDSLHERFIGVRAVPDRSFSAQVAKGAAASGQRVTPVLGTSDRVWIYADGNPWTAKVAYNEIYRGRLRALDELPFADGLRAFVRSEPPTPRVVTLDAVRAALEAGGGAVADPAGSELPVAADTPVTIHRVVPGRAELVARATADRLDEQAWSLVLTEAGVLPAGARAYQGTERAFWYRVAAPDGLDALRDALREANLFGVDVRPVVETRTGTWSELAAAGGGLKLGGDAIAASEIDRVSVSVAHAVPDDAVILLTDEQPDAYWHLLPIYIVMGLFALLFAWALFRAIRRMIPVSA